MTFPYQLGALPAQRPYGLSTLGVYAEGKLPEPPAEKTPPAARWQMFLNDEFGDCTIAGAANGIVGWNAEVNEHDEVPDTPEVKDTYFSLTGGVDSGLVEANVLQTWHRTGLFGHKIAGYAPVETSNFTEFHQAVAFYGAAYLGVALPQSAQQQFQQGQQNNVTPTWSVVPGSPIEGGHCILAVGYNQQYVQIVTWSAIVNVTYPWLAKYLTEVWAILPNQFVEAGRGPSLDLETLQADLSRI